MKLIQHDIYSVDKFTYEEFFELFKDNPYITGFLVEPWLVTIQNYSERDSSLMIRDSSTYEKNGIGCDVFRPIETFSIFPWFDLLKQRGYVKVYEDQAFPLFFNIIEDLLYRSDHIKESLLFT